MMKIISIEDLNLQHFQENNLNHDQIFSSHANHRYHGKTQFYLQANIQTILLCWCFGGLFVGFGLGFYLWWWWFLIFFSSIPQMSCPRGCSEQSTTLLTPSPTLSNFRCNYSTLTPGSDRSWTEKSQ